MVMCVVVMMSHRFTYSHLHNSVNTEKKNGCNVASDLINHSFPSPLTALFRVQTHPCTLFFCFSTGSNVFEICLLNHELLVCFMNGLVTEPCVQKLCMILTPAQLNIGSGLWLTLFKVPSHHKYIASDHWIGKS